ncbi:MAG: hypothetical protein HRU19_09490 [Pseudobacteriovorax sp.]|nr:hypothetical protein [Pseudobacteriovorax sp.]
MKQRETKFDTRLIIYRARQVILAIIVGINVIAFALFIQQGMANHHHWLVIGAPLGLIGLLYLLYPATEYWEYVHWQSKPRRIEQTSEK